MVSRAPIKSIKKHFAQFVRANCDPSDFFFLIDLRFDRKRVESKLDAASSSIIREDRFLRWTAECLVEKR